MQAVPVEVRTITASIHILAIVLIADAGGLVCGNRKFSCLDEKTCIPIEKFCDQNKDCPSGSDEPYRNGNNSYDVNTTFCVKKTPRHIVYAKICILPFQLRAHENELCRGSTCRDHEFQCKDGSQCVRMNKMCDGISYCDDGSDELPHKNDSITYGGNTTFCREKGEGDLADKYGRFEYEDYTPNYEYHELHALFTVCVVPDEFLMRKGEICDGSACKVGEFGCSDGSQCIALHMFCNQRIDCNDGSDEPPLRNFDNSHPGSDSASCRATRHKSKDVRSVCILPPELLPLKSDICDGSSCTNDEFACLDGTRCISSKLFCNGVSDCTDGSDEPPLRNNSITYDDGTTFCKGHETDGRTHVCELPANLVPQLERICTGTGCRPNQFRCHEGSLCLHSRHFCNGPQECPDGSDEIYSNLNKAYPSNVTSCRTHFGSRFCILPHYLVPYKDIVCRGSSCDPDEIMCMDGSKCVKYFLFCDGYKHCEDGSDEPPRRNNAIKYDTNTTFCKAEYGWICVLPRMYLAYEKQMCSGSSCKANEFQCADGSRCLKKYSVFNGRQDCPDGSDESARRDFNVPYAANVTFCRARKRGGFYPVYVLSPALMPYKHLLCDGSSCQSNEFTCTDGSACLSSDLVCDKWPQCKDNSDEPPLRNYNASYEANATFCRGRLGNGNARGRICVFPPTVVSQMENVCAGSLCTSDEYSCADGTHCISKYEFCNGVTDCPDGSDELTLYDNSIERSGKVTLCRSQSRHPGVYRLCILPARLIPYQRKICDGSSCKMSEFSCASGSRCIPKTRFCDNVNDCMDGSDEPYWNSGISYDSTVTSCRRHSSTSELARVCAITSASGSDMDEYCEGSSCTIDELSCDHGSRCIPMRKFCNGFEDCPDGEDERQVGQLETTGKEVILCRRAHYWDNKYLLCVLPPRFAPYKDALCDGSSCKTNEFACADGKLCIDGDDFCDGYPHCEDGSDELENPEQTNFHGRICHRNGRQCMIPDSNICDGVSWCENDIDECICPGNDTYHSDGSCFQCLSYPNLILPISKLCDRVFDCPDLTDECLCETEVRPNICEKISYDSVPNQENTTNLPFLECVSLESESTILLSTTKVCDTKFDCQNKEDETHCQSKVSGGKSVYSRPDYECSYPEGKFATACDGIPECGDFMDEECRCDDSIPVFCSYIEDYLYFKFMRHYPSRMVSKPRCKVNGTSGEYDLFLHVNDMCDGKMDCGNSADEIGCNSRFYCTDKPLPNIAIEKKCDKQNDCENEADEANCYHFACKDEGKLDYVSMELVCDGVKDCQSASDECQPGCINSAFSDEKSMITNKSILAISWIISLVALVGCSAVVVISVRHIIKNVTISSKARISSESNKLMNRLVLNLAVSDLLVGIYAFSICIKASQYGTDYCKVDIEWRSSGTCSALGAILVIGSEQSVFTMVIIAAQRLYSVMRPFSKPNVAYVTIVIAVSWTGSILLGIIPLIPQIEDYFVSSIGFSQNSIFKVMHYQEIPYMKNWLSPLNADQIQESGETDWSRMRGLIRKIDPNTTVAYEFGYYSSHTVCLPTFFPNPSMDKAWGYTFFLLLINFSSFLFMVVCYLQFYRRARKNLAMGEDKKNEDTKNLQRKLTRIVISDFLCWIPICIMGFLTLNGVNMPKDVYLPTGLLIVPINSALNPLLYSDLPEIAWRKIRRIGKTPSRTAQTRTEAIAMTERADVL